MVSRDRKVDHFASSLFCWLLLGLVFWPRLGDPLWVFASAKLLLPAVNSTLRVFMVFSIMILTSCDILYVMRQFIIQLSGTISYAFSLSIRWFGMPCFVCIVLSFVDISLISLLSPVFSGLFPQFVLLFFLCCHSGSVLTYSSAFPLFYHFGLFS